MPIVGVTHRRAGLPVIGRLRKGDPKLQADRPGSDTDHFRLDTSLPEVQEMFEAQYGKEPKRIDVLLPYRSLLENFPHDVEKWQSSGLIWRGNGERLSLWYDAKHGYVSDPEYKQGKPCPIDDPDCKWTGRLFLIVPTLWQAGYTGVLMMTTTSKHDVMSLVSELRAIEERTKGGDLRGLVMRLFRQEDTITYERGGKRTQRTHWGVHMAALPPWEQPFMEQIEARAYAGMLMGVRTEDSSAARIESGEPETTTESVHELEEEPEEAEFTTVDEVALWPDDDDQRATFVDSVKAKLHEHFGDTLPEGVTLGTVVKDSILMGQYATLSDAASDGLTPAIALILIEVWCKKNKRS